MVATNSLRGKTSMMEFRKTNENWEELISYKVRDEHPSLQEIMQEFRLFLLAVGYHPDGVEEHIQAE